MKFIRVKEVANKIGMSISTVKSYEEKGNFPTSIKTSEKVRVWLEEDVEKWMVEKVQQARGR